MLEQRSLRLPILLAVTQIIILATLITGWVLLTVSGALSSPDASLYWTLLTVGSLLFVVVLGGVVVYLTLTVKAFNLNRRQSNFIDSVTHELKSPIASLKLYLQTMSIREVSEQERQQFHKFMLEDVGRLDGLINHLLDAGNAEKRKFEQEKQEIRLDEILRLCGSQVCSRYRLDDEAITFELEPCQMYAATVDVTMIFRNLLDNAIKYAGRPPNAKVSMKWENDSIVVRVADNGKGIPKEMRRKVFGRFVRLGMELQRKKPGTGLGLYIVRTLVKRMKGKVQILEPLPGETWGTVFEVRLPGGKKVVSATANS